MVLHVDGLKSERRIVEARRVARVYNSAINGRLSPGRVSREAETD